jgi:hypothetical protein
VSVVFWSALGKVTVSGVTTLSASAASEAAAAITLIKAILPQAHIGASSKFFVDVFVRLPSRS